MVFTYITLEYPFTKMYPLMGLQLICPLEYFPHMLHTLLYEQASLHICDEQE